MGLFGRKKSEGAPPAPRAQTPAPTASVSVASQNDLDAADRLMRQYAAVRGNGSDQALAGVLERFADITGAKLSSGWNAPWAWWLRVAREAQKQGDHGLTGKIFLFAFDFNENIRPLLPNGYSVGLGYGEPDQSDYRALASAALDAFTTMQAEMPSVDFAPEIAQAQSVLAG